MHPGPGRPFSRQLLVILLLAGTFVYAGFIGMNIGAHAGGSDSSGYLNSARLLWNWHASTPLRLPPGLTGDQLPTYALTPLGFVPGQPGRMVPTYPVGLPLLVNATALVTGTRTAPNWTIWWHALAGVGLMFALARVAGLSPGWSALGALLLATSPLHVLYSLQMMSDVPATTWATATVIFAWWSRGNSRWALAAGFALGIAVLIRPTNALLILPVAIALGASRSRWLQLIAAGAPAGLTFLFYNWRAYGDPLASGYGNIGGLFQWDNLRPALATYREWLLVVLTPLGLLALGLPLCARRMPRWTALLAVWIASLFVLYAFYYHTRETWWYLRFLLPAFPAVWVAALLVLREILLRCGAEKILPAGSARAWLAGTLAAVAIFAFAAHWNTHFATKETGRGEQLYPDAIEWMQQRIPPNSVVAAMQYSGALFYSTGYPVVRWDQLKPPDFAKIARATAAARRPLFALLAPFEAECVFAENRLPGHWTQEGDFKGIALWRFDPAVP